MPMIYGEVYLPWFLDGLNIRFGRYISMPDIEAQLAPNNYMYSHSMTYGFDNYTNHGVVISQQVNKNVMVQFGVSNGTEATNSRTRATSIPCRRCRAARSTTPCRASSRHATDAGLLSGPGRSRHQAELHGMRTLSDRQRLRQSVSLRQRHQHRNLRIQQPAVVWLHLVPQVQRAVAHRDRVLAHAREQCAERQQLAYSTGRTDHAQSLLLHGQCAGPGASVRAIPTRPAPRANGRPSPT